MMCLSDLKPPGIEEELEQGEDRHVEVKVMTLIALCRVKKLSANDAGWEKCVHCQGYNLLVGGIVSHYLITQSIFHYYYYY